MTDTYTPRHLAPVTPALVVLCHPGRAADHEPFTTRADANRWINDHRHNDGCALDHRIVPAATLEWLLAPYCPASGLTVDADRVNGDWVTTCPTCAGWATCEPTDPTLREWRLDDHRPRVNPGGKTGIHGPECVAHDPDECCCGGTRKAVPA